MPLSVNDGAAHRDGGIPQKQIFTTFILIIFLQMQGPNKRKIKSFNA